ncbi:MAG TPA: hypothetical protein VN517_08830 [Terriglobales bacterium]|nr:hypothetical protein [Terriglobales bacterium]
MVSGGHSFDLTRIPPGCYIYHRSCVPVRGEDYVGGGFDPPIIVVEASIGFDGSKDCLAGDFGFDAALHDVFQDRSKTTAAPREEVEGDRVPVEGVSSEAVDFGDSFGPAPHDEGAFDGVSIRMVADLAFATVALEEGFVRFSRSSNDRLLGPGRQLGSLRFVFLLVRLLI